MQAIQINHYGGRDAMRLADAEIPHPGAGEALLRLEFAGVNFIDVYMREGHYQGSATYGSALPFTLGMEGAGSVEAVGAGVTQVDIGDRVAYCLTRGSYARYATVPAWRLVKLPDGVNYQTGTALMLQGLTAHYLSHSAFPLDASHSCLVHAGAGGVGRLLIQLARRRGARVIATVGSAAKAEIVRKLGADLAIQYRDTDFERAVNDATDGRGVDVVYDSVGKDTIERSLLCLRRRGTCINYGGSSGLVAEISPLALAEAGSVFFTRPHLAHYLTDRAELNLRATDLFTAYAAAELDVNIDRVFPLTGASDAHAALESRSTSGKLLLAMSDRPAH
ncbi:MAG: quinone oxidoreductase [Gammaproteobacteria bacterium]|nr:quinone oxidoreductase [Gammaproteobacteria bacterium]